MSVPYQVGTMVETPRAALTAAPAGRARGLLLDRLQRPDPDDVRAQPRRRRDQFPDRLPAVRRSTTTTPSPRSTPRASAPLIDTAVSAARASRRPVRGRRLRRAWRRPDVDPLVPPARSDLRQLLTVPGAGGAAGRRPRRPGRPRVTTQRASRPRVSSTDRRGVGGMAASCGQPRRMTICGDSVPPSTSSRSTCRVSATSSGWLSGRLASPRRVACSRLR